MFHPCGCNSVGLRELNLSPKYFCTGVKVSWLASARAAYTIQKPFALTQVAPFESPPRRGRSPSCSHPRLARRVSLMCSPLGDYRWTQQGIRRHRRLVRLFGPPGEWHAALAHSACVLPRPAQFTRPKPPRRAVLCSLVGQQVVPASIGGTTS